MSAASDAAAERTASATGTPAAAAAAAGSVDKTGYTGFGSFHSDDVEVLIRQEAAQYSPPALPFPDPADHHSLKQPSTGTANVTGSNQSSKHDCNAPEYSSRGSRRWGVGARQQFLIDFDRWTFINHGAFGGTSRWGRAGHPSHGAEDTSGCGLKARTIGACATQLICCPADQPAKLPSPHSWMHTLSSIRCISAACCTY
jgi:hypothetical protein